MTTELTNEQIVTELLISNEILKPSKRRFITQNKTSDLGKYVADSAKLQKSSRYAFIDLNYFE